MEIDFIVNKLDTKIYIQSAFQMLNDDKVKQEVRPFTLTNDFFKKVIIRNDIINSFYDNQDYEVETNLFLVIFRYYSPELVRFIQPAYVSSLNPSSINGLNLYSYSNNNPISIAYRSSSVDGSTGGENGRHIVKPKNGMLGDITL